MTFIPHTHSHNSVRNNYLYVIIVPLFVQIFVLLKNLLGCCVVLVFSETAPIFTLQTHKSTVLLWNLSNPDTNGSEDSALFSEVS